MKFDPSIPIDSHIKAVDVKAPEHLLHCPQKSDWPRRWKDSLVPCVRWRI